MDRQLFFPDGVHNVLVTPFSKNISTDDEYYEPKIDYNSLSNLYYKNIKVGYPVQGLVLLGTTSETSTLSKDEKEQIIKYIWNVNLQQLPENRKFITIGIGGNNMTDVLNSANDYCKFCDGFMLTVPYYNKPQQRGIVNMFQRVSKKFPNKPIMIYNIPSRTGTDLLPSYMAEIVKTCPNVVALKEASGNWNNVMEFSELISNYRIIGKTFKIFSGDDGNIPKIMNDFKGNGVISVAGNVYPLLIHYIVSGYNNYEEYKEYFDVLNKLVKILFSESNPVPVKWLLSSKKYIQFPSVREPLMEFDYSKITKEEYNILKECDRLEYLISNN